MKKGGNPNLGWGPDKEIAYARTPVQLKVLPGVRERLMAVDDWRNRLRRFIDELLAAAQEAAEQAAIDAALAEAAAEAESAEG